MITNCHQNIMGTVHPYLNSDPSGFDSDCATCGGKNRDCVHGANDDERSANVDPYYAGAIISSSWGYDQTNYDFFQIVKRSGEWVSLIPLNSRKIESTGFMTGTVAPGEPMKPSEYVSCVGTWNGKPIRRKLAFRDGVPFGLSIKHGWASVWDGQPEHYTAYA